MVKEKTEIAEREQYLSALKNALEKGATSETFEDLWRRLFRAGRSLWPSSGCSNK